MGLAGDCVRHVAVVGSGSIGMRHVKVLRQIEGLGPIAIPKRAHRLGELSEQGIQVARDIGEAVEKGATHCIIASDTGEHLRDALDAVRHGLEVLVEKPMAVNAREARVLHDTARELGRKVFVACCLRFSNSLNEFRSLLETLGGLHSVHIECRSYLPDWRPGRDYRHAYSARACDGGVLRDLIHELDYAGWLYGWPEKVHACLRNLGRLGIEAEEAADLMWETPDGCVVSVRLDYLSRPSCRRMIAAGERGTLEWDGIEGTVTLSVSKGQGEVRRLFQDRDDMFLEQVRAFFKAGGGFPDPRLATGEDGVKALAICDASRRASQSRREETVEYL